MNFGQIASGLSAAYPGFMQGQDQIASTEIKQQQLQQALLQMAAMRARGGALAQMFGGPQGPGPGGAMGMPPGQSSTVMGMPQQPQQAPTGQPPGGMPGAGGPPMQQNAGPPPMQGAPPGGAPMGQPGGMGASPGQLDWRPIIQSIQRANPGAPPEVLAAAVDQYLPMMNQQARHEWQALSMQMRQQQQALSMQMRQQQLDMRQQALDARMEGGPVPPITQQIQAQAIDELEAKLGRQPTAEEISTELNRLKTAGKGKSVTQERWERSEQAIDELEAKLGRKPTAEEIATELNRLKTVGKGKSVTQERSERAIDELEAKLGRKPTVEEISTELNRLKTVGKGKSATQERWEREDRGTRQVLDTIDDAIEDVRKGYGKLPSTGIFGSAVRVGEVIANIAGWSDRTTANAFKQKIELLRTQLPRILAGRSQLGKDERERINRIIPGLEPGSTAPITFDDLKYIQKVVRSRSGIKEDAPAGNTGGSATQLKTMTPEAETLRQKALDAGHSAIDVEKKLRDLGYDPATAPSRAGRVP